MEVLDLETFQLLIRHDSPSQQLLQLLSYCLLS